MKKTTLLIALFALFAGSAAAEAQSYGRPGCCGTAYGNYYAPTYATTQAVAQRPVYVAGNSACCQGNVRAYYAGNCCGQPVVQNCCQGASPCAGQAVYQPAVTYQPAAAYGPPQPAGCSPYYVRRGSLGQPTVYVPGQPIRNFFRFFSL